MRLMIPYNYAPRASVFQTVQQHSDLTSEYICTIYDGIFKKIISEQRDQISSKSDQQIISPLFVLILWRERIFDLIPS